MINGPYEAEVISRQRPRPNASAVEMATLKWVGWFNNHCLPGAIGNASHAEADTIYYAALDRLDIFALLK